MADAGKTDPEADGFSQVEDVPPGTYRGKVLFIAETPDIRMWKEAKALKQLGWKIFLGKGRNIIKEFFDESIYEEVFHMTSLAGYSFVCDYFDVIHVHNEPDLWAAFAINLSKHSPVPVFHDCHKFVSADARTEMPLGYIGIEMTANNFCDRAIYTSIEQQKFANHHCGGNQAPSIILYNAPLEEFIPTDEQLLPKLKVTKKQKPSLVYAGKLSGDPHESTCLLDQFMEILRMGYQLFVFSPDSPPEYDRFKGYRNWYPMGHVPYEKLLTEMSRYHVGIIPYAINGPDSATVAMGMPNKMFDYLSAGLPVLTSKAMIEAERFLEHNELGFSYGQMAELPDLIDKAMKIKPDRFQFTMNHEVERNLQPMYLETMAAHQYRYIKPKGKIKLAEVQMNVSFYREWTDGRKFEYEHQLEAEEGEEPKTETREYETVLYGRRGQERELYFEAFVKGEEEAGFLKVRMQQAEKAREAFKERMTVQKKDHKQMCMERKLEVRQRIKKGFGKIPRNKKDIRISASIIFKDEQNTIEETILSVYFLCDEIVAVDTGCTDDSRKILTKYPKIRIIDYPHKDEKWDFSKARNFSMLQCRGKWIVSIDADEELKADQYALRRQLLELPETYVVLWDTLQMSEDWQINSHLTQVRIYPNNEDFHWESAVHNQLKYPEEKYRIPDGAAIQNYHWGNIEPEKVAAREARSRTFKEQLMAEIQVKIDAEEPLDIEEIYNLIKLCGFLGDNADALPFAEKGLPVFEALELPEQRAMNRFLIGYANLLICEGRWDEGHRIIDRQLAVMGETVDGCFVKHSCAYHDGDMVGAFMAGIKFLELIQVEPELKPFNMAIMIVFKGHVFMRLEWIKYFINNHLEINKEWAKEFHKKTLTSDAGE